MVHKRNNEELRIINYLSLKEAHVRMMERDLGIPRATLIRRLKEMEELNIIDYKTEKSGQGRAIHLMKICLPRH